MFSSTYIECQPNLYTLLQMQIQILLSFQTGRRHALNQVSLKDEEDRHDRNQGYDGHGEQSAVIAE